MKFLLGLAVGFAAALLFAPARGEDTREKLIRGAQDLTDASQQKLHETAEKVSSVVQEKAGEIGGKKGREAAEKVAARVTGKVERTA